MKDFHKGASATRVPCVAAAPRAEERPSERTGSSQTESGVAVTTAGIQSGQPLPEAPHVVTPLDTFMGIPMKVLYAGHAAKTHEATRECENCGKQKPIEEMSTVFLPGAGESYQCEQCRGYP